MRLRIIRSLCFMLLALALVVMAPLETAQGKSVYLVAVHHQQQFDAYQLAEDGTLSAPVTHRLQCATSPSGVVIWEEVDESTLVTRRAFVFLSSEGSNCIEVLDAFTNTYVDCVCVPQAGMIDGIAMHPTTSYAGRAGDKVLYAIERLRSALYALDWDPETRALTVRPGFPVTLPTVTGAYGLTVDSDRGILYVADSGSGHVRGFDLGTLTTAVNEVFTWKPKSYPIDVVIDEERNILYTTHPGGSCHASFPHGSTNDTSTCMYDINAGVEIPVECNCEGEPLPAVDCHNAMGVAVNEAKGYVYLTHGCLNVANHVSVWDPSTSPWTCIQKLPNIGTPAGIAVANVGVRTDPGVLIGTNIPDEACVQPGDEVEINVNYFYRDIEGDEIPVNDVEVEVQLHEHLTFVSASGGGVYQSDTHSVLWVVGTLQVGDDVLQTIRVKVSDDADQVLDISAEIRSEVPQDDWGFEETSVTVCPCELSCNAGGPYTIQCEEGAVGSVTLDGSQSEVCEGTYSWSSTCPGATFDDATSATPTLSVDCSDLDGPKECVVSLTVEYGQGNVRCDTTVEISGVDCSDAEASVTECWPPNHKFVLVEVLGVTPPDATITIDSITQDELPRAQGSGSGMTCPDGVLVDTEGDGNANAAGIRCEREGPGNGRVYRIAFTATKGGGECEGEVLFCVPHDQGTGNFCLDDGHLFDSTVCPDGRGGEVEGEEQRVYSREEFESLTPEPLFLRGDVDWDEKLNLTDGVLVLNRLFISREALDCPDAVDMNDDGELDVSDAIDIYRYLFMGDYPAPPPSVHIGPDPTPDTLGCD